MSRKQNSSDLTTIRFLLVSITGIICLALLAIGAGAQRMATDIRPGDLAVSPTAEKTPPPQGEDEDDNEQLNNPGSRSPEEVVRVASVLVCAAPSPQPNSCGVERWSVKTGTDADVGLVNLNSASPTTITSLHAIASPSPIPANNRVAPGETTQWVIQGTLVEYKLEDDSDYHLVVQDGANNTMVTEIPYPGNSPACVSSSSPFLPGIASSRCKFDGSGLPIATGSFQFANVPVRVIGVGMFDFPHGQTGASPNQIEFHPIIDIAFPTTTSTPTGTGSNVTVQLADASLTFTTVTAAGTTTSVPIDPSTSGTAPANNTLVGPALNFSTTATVTAPTNVCISVPYITDAAAFSRLNLLHLEGSTLIDRTTSRDSAQKKICGSVPSLGKTVISLGTGPTPTATSTGTATNTATPTATNTPGGTPANTPTSTPTRTSTTTPTNTSTNTPTNTPSATPSATPSPAGALVLSQVEGGNGFYTNDWIEVKNISAATQSLNGLSLYYGAALGNFGAGTFAFSNVSLSPGQYYLVQLGGGGGANPLPVTPDASTTSIFMSGTSGKIGLVVTSALAANTCGATATPCNATELAAFVDWVAYGAAGNGTAGNGEGGMSVNNGNALTSSQGSVRKNSGCQDTNNNNIDFDVVTNPVPRNTATALAPCTVSTPTATATFTNTATNTPTNTATSTAMNTPTNTATNTATPTLTATLTPTRTATKTPTFTPTNTATNTPTPTFTPMFTPTNTVTGTATSTPTQTPVTVQVSLPVVTASPGSDITVPVTVGDTTGLQITSYDLQVTYDPAIVQPAATPVDTTGTLSSGMLVTPFTGNSGHFIVSAFQGTNLAGLGTLINLNFTVVGSSGQSTALTFEDYIDPNNVVHPGFQFNEGVPGSSTTNGSVGIMVVGTAITGTVTYGNTTTPPKYISNVTVTGAGSPTVSTTTAAPGATAGQYTLTGFGSGSYTVSLSKTTGQNSITSNDAARIAQHVTGILPLTTDNQRVSADVSNNSSISSNDAALIARYVAGLGAPLGITGTWRFFVPPGPTFPVGSSPTSRTYASVTSSISGEDYVGLLMGEVTGNWIPGSARPSAGPERSSTTVTAPRLLTPADNEVVIPVAISGAANKAIISYEFDLRYDPAIIQPQANAADLSGSVSRGLMAVANAEKPGLLRVVVYGPLPLSGDGALLNLRFTAVGDAGSISPLAFERFMLNEGLAMTAIDGQIEISDTK
jgi:hypothetical protein